MRGSVSSYCPCRGADGRHLGNACPKRGRSGHVTWWFAVRLDTSDRDGRQLKRSGYLSRSEATVALEHVRSLVALAGDDDRLRRRIGDVIFERSRRRGALPTSAELGRRLGAGLDPATPSLTVGEWLTRWLASNRRVSESSRTMYRCRVEGYWRPHVGDIPLNRLRVEHIAGVLDWIRRRNAQIEEARAAGRPVPHDPLDRRGKIRVIGPATEKLVLAVLSTALNAAVREGLLVRNPCVQISLPEGERRAVRVWDPEQVAAFLRTSADDRLATLFRLVLLRGLRRGEVTGLMWSDVDLDAGVLHVRRSLAYAGPARGTRVGKPKTRSSLRAVSLTPGDVTALREHRRRQVAERLAAGETWRDEDWVFARPDGSPTPPWRVSNDFQRLARAAGLPVLRLHEGRHTAATLAWESGVEARLVSDQLGHSSTAITLNTYTHVRRARHDEAAERVDRLVFGDDDATGEAGQGSNL